MQEELYPEMSEHIEELERQIESYQKENDTLLYSLKLKNEQIYVLKKNLEGKHKERDIFKKELKQLNIK